MKEATSGVRYDQRDYVHQRIDKRLSAITIAKFNMRVDAWYLLLDDMYSEVHVYLPADFCKEIYEILSAIRARIYDNRFVRLRNTPSQKARVLYNNGLNEIIVDLSSTQNRLMMEMKKQKMLLPIEAKKNYGSLLGEEEDSYVA